MTILLDAFNVSVTRSDRVLFSHLSVTVSDRDRLGVVGINGTGKSTLLRVLGGSQIPEEGEVRRGNGVRVAILDQEADLGPGVVSEIVGDSWEAAAILERLDMGPYKDRQVSELSGGQVKRVALAKVLASPAEVLILDEPTNHLDLGGITWLEGWLERFSGAVVLVSHDRYLLDRVTTKMLELDRGKSYLHSGGYGEYLRGRAEREERSEEAESQRRNLARRELAWLRRGAKARSRKPGARVDAARKLLETRPEDPARTTELEMEFDTPRLGAKVIEAKNLAFRYPNADRNVFEDVTITMDRRSRIGVVGINGSGKSTLLEVLGGRMSPTEGTIEWGTTVKVGYFSQEGPDVDPTARVREVVAGPHRTPGELPDKKLMERFWFTGELPWAKVGTLSGGERRRLQLLVVLATQPNVLFLDEPTNDLDLDTLRALEEFLEVWPGALITISHDRAFLDRVTDRLLLCSDGSVSELGGGVEAWIAKSTGIANQNTKRSEPKAKSITHDHPKTPSLGSTSRSPSTIRNELRTLERRLKQLSAARDKVLASFEATQHHEKLAELGAELTTIQGEIEVVEERWLELSVELEDARS